MKRLLSIFAALLFSSDCFGQACPPENCLPQIIIGVDGQLIGYGQGLSAQELQAVEETNVDEWYKLFVGPNRQPTASEKALAEKIKFTSLRAYQGNGCGTGSLVGRDAEYIYIMSNAHVASTRIGSTTRLQAIVGGKLEQFSGTLIEVAYSNQYRTDWALLRASAENMKGIAPVQLSMTMPDKDADTVTWGHPRCATTRGHSCKTNQFGKVWLWSPNSVGGQSGSAVVQLQDGVPVQKGLLTWSEGGNGSGQFSASIFEQSRNRTNVGEVRTGKETIPVDVSNPFGVELQDTYSALEDGNRSHQEPVCPPPGFELDDKWGCLGNQHEVSLRDYPIWHTAPVDPVKPVDPVDPICPPAGLTPEQKEKLTAAKKLINEVLETPILGPR